MPTPDLTLLGLTDEELDTLAEITEADIIATQNFAAKVVDKRYKNLLLAVSQEFEEESNG